MGVFSNLFGGGAGYNNAGPTAVSSAQVTDEGFELQKPFIQDIFETAQAETYDIADDGTKTLRGYEEFLGPRLADFSTEQTEALSGLAGLGRQGLAGTSLAASPQYFQQAKDAVTQGQRQFTSADADRLMNPFLDEVIDIQQREARRSFDRDIVPKLDAEAVAAGSFGGSRAGLMQAEAERNLQQRLDDISAKGRLTAFEQAQKAFEQEQGRQFQGAQLATALGTEAPAQAARELGLLSSAGEVQQAQEQKALDLAEAEFIRQRDFPMKQLQEYQSLVRGFPFNPSTFEVGSKYQAQPTFGQQLLGGLGTAAGLFGAFGGFSPGKKAGGQVVSRQSGGQVRGGLAGLERHQNNVLYTPLPNARMFGQPVGVTAPATLSELAVQERDRGVRNTGANLLEKISNLLGTPRTVKGSDAWRASIDKPIVTLEDALKARITPRVLPALTRVPLSEAVRETVSVADEGLGEGEVRVGPRTIDYIQQQTDDMFAPFGATPPKKPYETIAEQFMSHASGLVPGGKFDTRKPPVSNKRARGVPEVTVSTEDLFAKDIGRPDMEIEERKETVKKEISPEKPIDQRKTKPDIPDVDMIIGAGDEEKATQTAFADNEYNADKDNLRKLLDDYQATLRDEEKSIGTKREEAERRRSRNLYLELVATSMRFGSMGGPEGLLAKALKAGEPSIAQIKNITDRFDKENDDLDKIKKDVKKGLYNSEVGYQRYAEQRRKTNAEIKLLEAKALAEGLTEAMDIDQAAKYLELSFPKSMNEHVKTSAVRKFLELRKAGHGNRSAALQTVAGVERILASGGRAETGKTPAGNRLKTERDNLTTNVTEKLGRT